MLPFGVPLTYLCALPSCEEEEEKDGSVQSGAQEEDQGP